MIQPPLEAASIRIVGMSRSGNHAIIDWLLRALDGRRWCFLNCVEPGADPWASARPMDDGRRWVASHGAPLSGSHGSASSPRRSLDYVVRSYEDCFLKPVLGVDHEASAAVGRQCRDVLILRDPFNLFASRRRSATGGVNERVALRIWKQHARTFLQGRFGRRPIVPISYNAWVVDAAYRNAVMRSLGLPGPTGGIGVVARCNGGSSFDGLAFADRPERMRVFQRWRHYADERSFWAVFDEDAYDLASRIFAQAELPS